MMHCDHPFLPQIRPPASPSPSSSPNRVNHLRGDDRVAEDMRRHTPRLRAAYHGASPLPARYPFQKRMVQKCQPATPTPRPHGSRRRRRARTSPDAHGAATSPPKPTIHVTPRPRPPFYSDPAAAPGFCPGSRRRRRARPSPPLPASRFPGPAPRTPDGPR